MNSIWILAGAEQTEGQEGSMLTSEQASEQTQQQSITSSDGTPATEDQTKNHESVKMPYAQWAFLGLILFMMYLMLFRGPKKKQQEHERMVKSLKKNDRVRTVGGIFGTVIDVKDDEITLKIDESNNTKIKVTPTAIGAVLADKTGQD